ncbi:hypothetical protein Tco_0050881, partial [Tanacetum coccineum]
VTKSLKSSCRVAQFYYDQGERMLLMGKMTKVLNHARECRNHRYDLLKENFDLTLRDAKLYSFHMNHVVAARAWSITWSITFEEFILAPNINFVCYLDSILQDGRMALAALEWGKSLSLKRPFILSRAFPCCVSITVDLTK